MPCSLTRRPFTPQERDLLDRILHQRPVRPPLWVRMVDAFVGVVLLGIAPFLMGVMLVGLPLLLLGFWLFGTDLSRITGGILFLGPGTIVVGIVCVRGLRRRHQPGLDLAADLDNHEAEVLHCTCRDAVFFDPFEDEGPRYFFDVGDGRILFLGGQYLEEFFPEEEPGGHLRGEAGPWQRFPNREFIIVRDPQSELVLDVQCLGQPLPPSRVVSAAEFDTAALIDWMVFDGSLATLEADIHRLHRQSVRV